MPSSFDAGNETTTLSRDAIVGPGHPAPEPAEAFPMDAVTEQETSAIAVPSKTLGSTGRYVVLGELGRGGMGVVWRAYDPRLQREVALKTVHSGSLSDEQHLRLVREAQAMARLSHPNVVAIYDVEREESQVILAMELVEGSTLGQWIRERPREPQAMIQCFIEAGRGLVAAHGAGLLHRDFKPSNVLMGRGGAIKVTDFGLAIRAADFVSEPTASMPGFTPDRAQWDLTRSDEVHGTFPYMPPEQHEARPLTPAVDQYAFCVALWEALAGRRPFAPSDDARDPIRSIFVEKLNGPPEWNGARTVPARWVRALQRGLSPEPEQRWPSMAALLAELSVDPSRRQRRRIALGAGLLALAGGVGVTVYVQHQAALRCEAEGAAIASEWSADQAESIGLAFASTELPYARDTWDRVVPRVDEWAHQWQEARVRVCGSDGGTDLTPIMRDRARSCLDEQRVRLRTLVEQWGKPDAVTVQEALMSVWTLPSLEACTDPLELARHMSGSADTRTDAQDLREQLAQGYSLLSLERTDEALEIGRAVLSEATERGAAAQIVGGHLLMGEVQIEQGHFEPALESMEHAFVEAESSADDWSALLSAEKLGFVLGFHLHRFEDAARWIRLARGKLGRLEVDTDHPLAGNVDWVEGTLLVGQQRYEDALAMFSSALAIYERAYSAEHPKVGKVLGALATTEANAGYLDRALDHNQQTVDLFVRGFGAQHPKVGLALHNLAVTFNLRAEHQRTLDAITRALEIREATLPADHLDIAISLTVKAVAQTEFGDLAGALRSYQRAVPVIERTYGPDHMRTGLYTFSLASSLADLKRWDEALEQYTAACRPLEKNLGFTHTFTADCEAELALAMVRRGSSAAGLERLEGQLERLREAEADQQVLQRVSFVLAKARHAAGQRDSAMAVARRLAAEMEDEDDRAKIEEWIASVE